MPFQIFFGDLKFLNSAVYVQDMQNFLAPFYSASDPNTERVVPLKILIVKLSQSYFWANHDFTNSVILTTCCEVQWPAQNVYK